MTNNHLLDIILKLYLQDMQWTLIGDLKHSKVTFTKLVKSQDPNIEEWQIKILKEQLFEDKFLNFAKYGDEEPFTLTNAGIKAAQSGWYESQSEKTEQERIIRINTIKDSNRSKTALRISIFAIIVPTIISLGALWLNSQKPEIKEIQEMREQIHNLTNKIDLQKRTLDSLQIVPLIP